MSPSVKRSILITGASAGGSGHALALEFASKGFRVFATARSTKSLTELEAKGIETLPLEVTNAESIASLKAEITQRTGGKLDILFNNAGTMYENPAIEADPAKVRNMFNANVFGVFDMVQAFYPLLLAAVAGSQTPPTIINTASVVARIPFIFASGYNASKAAVASYSDTLRIELAPLGIKVVTLYMGEVSTGLMLADNIAFGSNSLYASAEEGVRERSRHHAKASMSTQQFAQQVVAEIVSKSGLGKGEYVWKGSKAGLVWFLNAVGPRKVFDGTMLSDAGVDSNVSRAIYEKGQQSVKQG